MDEQMQRPQRPVNPRRRVRTKAQIFKESYLPVIIVGAAILLILVLIIGSALSSPDEEETPVVTVPQSNPEADEAQRLQEEAAQIMQRAEAMAEQMDYNGAIEALDSFSGDLSDPKFADMAAYYDELVLKRSQLVTWNDPSQVLHLSIQLLIADPNRAYNDAYYSDSFRNNFLTTQEFSDILPQLYEAGYMLVSMDDIITTTEGSNGNPVYTAKTLYLPQGKKPLLLTQTNVNYPEYLIPSGFGSKLVYDESGNISVEYVDADGQTQIGDYDMIPILDKFVSEHPDFSYKGAKATIALTGYEGVFGYRIDPSEEDEIGTAAYEQRFTDIRTIADDLRANGYELACFCYNDKSYASLTEAEIQEDLENWTSKIVPIIGELDTFVFARNGDIAAPGEAYSGEKYEHMKTNGFTVFIGFCDDSGTPWCTLKGDYVRMGRVLLSPSNLVNHPEWFEGINGTLVVDPARGNIRG